MKKTKSTYVCNIWNFTLIEYKINEQIAPISSVISVICEYSFGKIRGNWQINESNEIFC